MSQVRKIEAKLSENAAVGPATSRRAATELSNYQLQIEQLDRDIAEIQARMQERENSLNDGARREPGGNQRLPNESQRDFLIRTGKITPFSKFGPDLPSKNEDTLRDALLNAETGPAEFEPPSHAPATDVTRSHRVLLRPGFVDKSRDSSREPARGRPVAKKRRLDGEGSSPATGDSSAQTSLRATPLWDEDSSDYTPATSVFADARSFRSDGSSDDDSSDDSFLHKSTAGKPRMKMRRQGRVTDGAEATGDSMGLDDGNEDLYQARLQSWVKRRKHARQKATGRQPSTVDNEDGEAPEEWHLPHPTTSDAELDGGYRVPGDVHPSLFDYQRTGVQWLWELYSQHVGGIVGDEMGLGKTVQVISFLAGLHYSKKITKPTIIVAPATVMKQWVNEFHTWWPPFRVSILHSSGSGMIDIGRESRHEDELLRSNSRSKPKASTKAQRAAQKIVDRAMEHGHVLVTSYSGLQTYAELLVPMFWEYAVLDEGHKIRNPNAAITLFCKELRTPNRIILSGTPIQNNLVELWSLFDFIFPMRLGTLVDFKSQFEIPIRIGGYASASNLQIQTANKCAEALKDAISPYLLQRLKLDVAADLPKKTERVLFCKLTKPQRDAYENFLGGDDIRSIFAGKRNVLFGVDMLRKICNHPDLQDHKVLSVKHDYPYGMAKKSGKMIIVKELLDIWKRAGHKTLLFAQHRIMLDILEKYIRSMPGVNHRRMDGNTPIPVRQSLVDEFNRDPSIHVFLLTTKVGGLGVNLTGADRVIIFDPDWNPSTDVQARERAWRLGQTREVEIYRLMVAGTIEEKIFHRQIFKQFLTNKILKDPKQRQTFQMQDLHDLFSLGDATDEVTETSKLFEGSEVQFDKGSAAHESNPNKSAVKPGSGRSRRSHLRPRRRRIRKAFRDAHSRQPRHRRRRRHVAPPRAARPRAAHPRRHLPALRRARRARARQDPQRPAHRGRRPAHDRGRGAPRRRRSRPRTAAGRAGGARRARRRAHVDRPVRHRGPAPAAGRAPRRRRALVREHPGGPAGPGGRRRDVEWPFACQPAGRARDGGQGFCPADSRLFASARRPRLHADDHRSFQPVLHDAGAHGAVQGESQGDGDAAEGLAGPRGVGAEG